MDELFTKLANVLDKLGLEAVRVWPSIVAVTYVRAWVAVIVALLSIPAYIWLARKVVGWMRKHDSNEFDKVDRQFAGGALLFFGGAVVLFSIITALAWLPAIFYPEAMTVLNFIGK